MFIDEVVNASMPYNVVAGHHFGSRHLKVIVSGKCFWSRPLTNFLCLRFEFFST